MENPDPTPFTNLQMAPPKVSRISNNDEMAYRKKVKSLATWCQGNNLSLNVSKTKELVIDFTKWGGVSINSAEVEISRVSSSGE